MRPLGLLGITLAGISLSIKPSQASHVHAKLFSRKALGHLTLDHPAFAHYLRRVEDGEGTIRLYDDLVSDQL